MPRTLVTRVVALCVVMLAWLASLAEASELAPSHAAAIFHIGAGARALAMGGAFVGLSDDANALYYNPAGLASLEGWEVTSLYSTQYDVIRYGVLGLTTRGVGVGVQYLDSHAIPGTGEGGEILDQFSYINVGGLGAGAVALGPVSVGARVKYLTVTSATIQDGALKTVQGSGMGMDIGTLAQVGRFRLGAVYHNLWSQPIRYSTGTAERWEGSLTVGASARLGPVLVAADLEQPGGPDRYYRVGAELSWSSISLRAGAAGPLSGPGSGGMDLTAGLGLRLGRFNADYALLLPADLPESHRLSLTVRF